VPYVLVAEDEPDERRMLALFLQYSGFEVGTACNGNDALLSVFNRLPDAIVLDLRMPEMSGVRLLEVMRLYQRMQSIPVIVLSAVPWELSVSVARQLNVHHVLEKTRASFEDVVAAIHEELVH
jgi:CheY-like chemotaxis protein